MDYDATSPTTRKGPIAVLKCGEERRFLRHSKWNSMMTGARARGVSLMVSLLCSKRKRLLRAALNSLSDAVSNEALLVRVAESSARRWKRRVLGMWHREASKITRSRGLYKGVRVLMRFGNRMMREAFRVWKTNLECNDRKRLLRRLMGEVIRNRLTPRPWFDRWYQITLSMRARTLTNGARNRFLDFAFSSWYDKERKRKELMSGAKV